MEDHRAAFTSGLHIIHTHPRSWELGVPETAETLGYLQVIKVDHVYFEEKINPLLSHPLVDYVGEIGEGEKDDFWGKAKALLFPLDWPEPFGLVMIEALACGTPVIAYQRGSVPEVLAQGLSGFIVQNFKEAVKAIENIESLKRATCRQIFEERFTVEIMAKEYLSLYSSLMHLGSQLEAA